MTDLSFSESLLSLKPLYYHFLDGYLNENSGSNLNIVKDMFVNYKFTRLFNTID